MHSHAHAILHQMYGSMSVSIYEPENNPASLKCFYFIIFFLLHLVCSINWNPKINQKQTMVPFCFVFLFLQVQYTCFVFADMTEEGSAQKRMLGMLLAFSLWSLG